MKLSKVLKEELLKEADGQVDEISVDAPAAEIADEVKDQANMSGVSLSDAQAEETAEVAKEIGDKIDSDQISIIPTKEAPLAIKNRLTEALDAALEAAQYFRQNHINERANVLVCGLPGSSKTASVYNWGKGKVHITYVNAKNNDLDAFINGYTVQDPEDKLTVRQAVSRNLDGLDRENSVLFIDELNRQTKAQIRASLLTLINEHYVVGKERNGRHYFKNFLFTIAAVNPGGTSEDEGAVRLNDAEKSRYLYTVNDFDSDVDTTASYLNQKYLSLAKRLASMKDVSVEDVWADDENEDDDTPLIDSSSKLSQWDRIEAFLRTDHLGEFIVHHTDFEYDKKDKVNMLDLNNKTMLNQRSLTAGLAASAGKVDKFRKWVTDYSNFLDEDIEMLLGILDDYAYQIPTLDDLLKMAGISKAQQQVLANQSSTSGDVESPVETPESPKEEVAKEEEEDDDDFFVNPTAASGKKIVTPNEAKKAIADALANW